MKVLFYVGYERSSDCETRSAWRFHAWGCGWRLLGLVVDRHDHWPESSLEGAQLLELVNLQRERD